MFEASVQTGLQMPMQWLREIKELAGLQRVIDELALRVSHVKLS
jgi:hypothetical protein